MKPFVYYSAVECFCSKQSNDTQINEFIRLWHKVVCKLEISKCFGENPSTCSALRAVLRLPDRKVEHDENNTSSPFAHLPGGDSLEDRNESHSGDTVEVEDEEQVAEDDQILNKDRVEDETQVGEGVRVEDEAQPAENDQILNTGQVEQEAPVADGEQLECCSRIFRKADVQQSTLRLFDTRVFPIYSIRGKVADRSQGQH